MRIGKMVLIAVTACLTVFVGWGLLAMRLPSDAMIAGLASKLTCSAHFISRRDLQSIIDEDINSITLSWLFTGGLTYSVSETNRTVTAHKGNSTRIASYTPDYGCTLHPTDTRQDRTIAHGAFMAPSYHRWPTAWSPQLREALDLEFRLKNGKTVTGARGVVVVQNGAIIGERYAPGFNSSTPQLGWSMAKTVLSMLVSMRIQDGALALTDKPSLPATKGDITLQDLLYMRSGLDINESYLAVTFSDKTSVPQMLWETDDTSLVAHQASSKTPTGQNWAYSSATSNLLSNILRQSFAKDADYWSYPKQRLFAPLGITSAVFETDAAGNFVASSYLYATPRDWARLGELMRNDGQWQGIQILPTGWVKTATQIPDNYKQHDNGPYGAHIWLTSLPMEAMVGKFCDIPDDAFFFSGHWGQKIAIVPSENLVIVRLGWTTGSASWHQCQFLENVIDAARN